MPRPDGAGLPGVVAPACAEHAAGSRKLLWEVDGRDWPNRQTSRFVEAGGLRWHVQCAGSGKVALLLHGTGASTHSWRDLAPELARRHTVIAPDLPGHGFTQAPPAEAYSLPDMARATAALLAQLGSAPDLVVGHSAGAAIALRMILDGHASPAGVVSLNGALLPFRGLPGQLFSPAARFLARFDFVPRLVARRAADPAAIERLLRDTGSRIDERGVTLYRRLMCSPGHVAATLAMMSHWDLAPMTREYRDLALPVLLVVGEADGTVPPSEADRVARLMRRARVRRLPGLGHLAHEECPREVGDVIVEFARAPEVDA